MKETSRSCIEQLPSPSAVKAEIKLRMNSPRFKDLSIKKNIEEYKKLTRSLPDLIQKALKKRTKHIKVGDNFDDFW